MRESNHYRNSKPKKKYKSGWIETHYHQNELLTKSHVGFDYSLVCSNSKNKEEPCFLKDYCDGSIKITFMSQDPDWTFQGNSVTCNFTVKITFT